MPCVSYMPYVTYVHMARGRSGRIVIDVEPALKKELYVVLAENESTLKDWFVDHVRAYVDRGRSAQRKKDGRQS